MAPSHRKKTVGKRSTTESSPPGDRKIKRRNADTHPGFNIRASSSSAFKRPSSKLKARTRINISWDSRSYPRSMQHSMRARLGPQEPGRPRPPIATTWAMRPDPVVIPMVQNVLPHRDLMVTPMVRNVHSHPLAPSAKGWTTCSPRLSALTSFITSPKDSSYQNFPHTMGPVTLRPYHALSTTHDARYWQRLVQSIPLDLQGGPSHGFIAYLPTRWQFRGLVRSFRGTILVLRSTQANIELYKT
ncbi:hypothetical protein AAG906_025564 [Vitis piasezkii]